MKTPAEAVQQDPQPTAGKPIWSLVIEDMIARDEV